MNKMNVFKNGAILTDGSIQQYFIYKAMKKIFSTFSLFVVFAILADC